MAFVLVYQSVNIDMSLFEDRQSEGNTLLILSCTKQQSENVIQLLMLIHPVSDHFYHDSNSVETTYCC